MPKTKIVKLKRFGERDNDKASIVDEFLERLKTETGIQTETEDLDLSEMIGANDLASLKAREIAEKPDLKKPLSKEVIGWTREMLLRLMDHQPSVEARLAVFGRILETINPQMKVHSLEKERGLLARRLARVWATQETLKARKADIACEAISEESLREKAEEYANGNEPYAIIVNLPSETEPAAYDVFISEKHLTSIMPDFGAYFAKSFDRSFTIRRNNEGLNKEYLDVVKAYQHATNFGKYLTDTFGVQTDPLTEAMGFRKLDPSYFERIIDEGGATEEMPEEMPEEAPEKTPTDTKPPESTGEGWIEITQDEQAKMLEKAEKEIEKEDMMRWALGNLQYRKMRGRLGQNHDLMLKEWRDRLEGNPLFRRKVERAIERHRLLAEREMVLAMTRSAIRMMLFETREVSAYEYVEKRLRRLLIKKKNQVEEDEETETEIKEMEEYLKTHKEEKGARLLNAARARIWSEKVWADEMAFNVTDFFCMKRSLIQDTFAQISRFKGTEDLKMPDWEKGLPRTVIQERAVTCFSGAWLLTASLLGYRFEMKDFLYAHINQGENGLIGGHGAVVFIGERDQLELYDMGHNIAGSIIPWKMALKTDNYKQQHLKDLCGKRHNEPVKLEFLPHVAKACGIPRNMVLLPLHHGFANGHMYHMGMSFLEEGRLEEAHHSFNLALSLNPMDAESLHGLAKIEALKKNYKETESYLDEALNIFPDHLPSHYMKAELALARLEGEEARRYYRKVADFPNPTWRSVGIRCMAKLILPTLERLIEEGGEKKGALAMLDLLKKIEEYAKVILSA